MAAAPPWLQPAMDAMIQPLQQQFRRLEQNMNAQFANVNQQFADVNQQLRSIRQDSLRVTILLTFY
jgi:hypothetical protein